ncbi:hypothetical protein [uncultured Cohaesibacter sp.]|uniref:hypothetical protein n=1 Tax=uncultured Cohaesibacter sp. TaxID=1002546 RepID=UPI002931EEA2|nr:hypothetical protein [uncultured Cohaesibacter sp.]
MIKVIHPIAGALALLMISSFWLSTAFVELFAGAPIVVMVKQLIPWGFTALIPAIVIAGLSGNALGKKWRNPIVGRKRRRMPIIAANGIVILIPAALYLSAKAQAGQFDTGFYVVQLLELVAGSVNITLLGLSMRDGLGLSGRVRPGSLHSE